MKFKPSVYEDEQELLLDLIELHCSTPIQLDPMYSKGNFYKKIPSPELKFDICPQKGVREGDACNLSMLKSASISTMILDPPFCFGIHGKTEQNISAKRFTILKDFNALRHLYCGILSEASRILKLKGVLLFKCQDYTDSRTTMTHCLVHDWAKQVGFYPKDLAILVNRNRIWNPKLTQRHLRKVHCYFWVFVK